MPPSFGVNPRVCGTQPLDEGDVIVIMKMILGIPTKNVYIVDPGQFIPELLHANRRVALSFGADFGALSMGRRSLPGRHFLAIQPRDRDPHVDVVDAGAGILPGLLLPLRIQ